ncbi:serine/threonine protein phosphatase [Candidatus Bathyarchaeota archaeon]|nr:serine/threonine protein phosphatase [Candidatus Bathyarchaeota archaeon]
MLSRTGRIVVIGDIHGDYSVINPIMKMAEDEENFLVFLGDYADRGRHGVEVVETVATLLRKYPERVLALKGNHEDYTEDGAPRFYPCDLIREARKKGRDWITYFRGEFKPFVEQLYLAAAIPNEVLLVHGGVSSKIVSLEDLRRPVKVVEADVLWSDPFEGYGEYPNRRGVGVEFGVDVTERVCRSLGVKRIVRSHEPMKALNGYYSEHGGRVITISSTSVYHGRPFVLTINPKNPSEVSQVFLR